MAPGPWAGHPPGRGTGLQGAAQRRPSRPPPAADGSATGFLLLARGPLPVPVRGCRPRPNGVFSCPGCRKQQPETRTRGWCRVLRVRVRGCQGPCRPPCCLTASPYRSPAVLMDLPVSLPSRRLSKLSCLLSVWKDPLPGLTLSPLPSVHCSLCLGLCSPVCLSVPLWAWRPSSCSYFCFLPPDPLLILSLPSLTP